MIYSGLKGAEGFLTLTIQAISKGSDDVGKVHMQVEYDGSVYYGFGANTDIVTASVEAYLDCINKFRG